MPHEKIWDRHNTSALPGEDHPDQNALEVCWNSGPDSEPDGWVQVVVDRPGVDARGVGDQREIVGAAFNLVDHVFGVLGLERKGEHAIAHTALVEHIAPMLRHHVGPPAHRLAIQLDRDGVNRLIKSARRAGRTAYGTDEW
jgi:hypothetical protein